MSETKSVPTINYTDAENEFRQRIITELEWARQQRSQNWDEFDGMTYEEYWESNAKAAASYIPPRINIEDVRVTTGTTKEKGNTLLASILNYNLEPDIEAFDKQDKPVEELGEIMQDMVRKSRQLEMPEYDVKRPVVYKELLDQGTIFVEDTWKEFKIPDHVAKNLDMTDLSKIDFEEKMEKVYKYADTDMLNGLGVYLGNMKEFYLELQPYIGLRRVLKREVAKSLYGSWERWKYVPEILTQNTQDDSDSIPFNSWAMLPINYGFVEEIRYFNKWTNSFQILLNGVMMFPVKKVGGKCLTVPLSSINGKCDYPIAKGDIEPISRYFAYSKSIPAKTKVDQALLDEMMKAIILKTRKSYQPPMANNTGKSLTKSVFFPGTIHADIDPDKLKEIGVNQGVTPSEFNAVSWLKGIVDQKTMSPIFEGQKSGTMTAREVIELKQQGMMKMGLVILGVMNLEKKLSALRLYNILKHWTEAQHKDLKKTKDGLQQIVNNYRQLTVSADINGREGQRIIEFSEEMPEPQQVMAEEDILSTVRQTPVRKAYLNPKEIAKTVDYNWNIEIVPTEKQTSELKKALFMENVKEGMAIFGPQAFNQEYLKERWANLNNEDYNKMFMPMPQGMMPPVQPGGGGDLMAQMRPQKPSLSELVGSDLT